MNRWMIYGANGYTGALIAREAARRGWRPLLAGRKRDAVDALAHELSLPRRVFALDHPDEVRRNLAGIGLVLNCAGPFSQTCAPLLEACLDGAAHYLDITGEIDVFARCHRVHARAQQQGVVVLPGVGFDVVPTDCLAAMLKRRLPDADALVLAFEAGGGPSPGTAKTSIEGLAKGGRARIDGELRTVPLAWKTRTFSRDGVERTAVTIPWGDLYTAFVTTGIPNIETYMVVSPRTIARLRWLRYLQPLFRLPPVQGWMKRRIERSTPGPSTEQRRASTTYVWGEVRNPRGDTARLALCTPNGYDLTVTAALGIVESLLEAPPPANGGYFTPAQRMGADYVLRLPGVRLIEA
jgi:short subunit dehydrogenase-like uncharacterized protein